MQMQTFTTTGTEWKCSKKLQKGINIQKDFGAAELKDARLVKFVFTTSNKVILSQEHSHLEEKCNQMNIIN